MDPEELGLGLGSVLLNNLKQTVVVLASNAGVLNTVQTAAQAVLQSGWSVLLPTAEERARALSSLLPNAGERKSHKNADVTSPTQGLNSPFKNVNFNEQNLN